MAIGGGGGGRGRGKDGEVKNRPDPTGKQDLFGSRAYFESNAAVLGKNGGASRKRSANTKSRNVLPVIFSKNSCFVLCMLIFVVDANTICSDEFFAVPYDY
jgi:hypothetical protein